MSNHRMLISQVLKNLGHRVPSEEELTGALKKAFVEVKKEDGVDPDTVKYKLTMVPVSKDWVKETF